MKLVVAAILILLAFAGNVPGEPPTNLRLLGAMTPSTDSVLIWRMDKLREEGSILKEFCDKFPLHDPSAGPTPATEVDAILAMVVRKAEPLVCVMAGSKFRPPKGIGAGRYDERWIWCTKDPLTELRKRFEAKENVTGLTGQFEFEGVTVFQAKATPVPDGSVVEDKENKKDRFVAFYDDRTLVVTDRREELETIVKNLKAGMNEVPTKWTAITEGVEIESPVVLLRKFDPKDAEDLTPVNPKLPAADRGGIDLIAISLPDPKKRVCTVRAITTDQEKDIRFFILRFFGSPWRWQVTKTDNGFSGEIACAIDEDDGLSLRLIIMFGWWIYI